MDYLASYSRIDAHAGQWIEVETEQRPVKANEASERVAPVEEFFGHVGQNQHLYAALVASRKLQDSLDLARAHFARGIERRLATLPRVRGIPAAELPALASALAGSLLALLI